MGADDGRRDFDFFVGTWRVENRKLVGIFKGSTEWREFTAANEVWPILGGMGTIDRFRVADWPDGRPFEGTALHVFDPASRDWSLYWVDNRTGQLQKPVVGRFRNGRGEFFNDDTFNGQPIRVRNVFFDLKPGSFVWEQAFSPDGGQSWETNWRMVNTREA